MPTHTELQTELMHPLKCKVKYQHNTIVLQAPIHLCALPDWLLSRCGIHCCTPYTPLLLSRQEHIQSRAMVVPSLSATTAADDETHLTCQGMIVAMIHGAALLYDDCISGR